MSEAKKLKRLNFLNKTVKLTKNDASILGEVFFFSSNALILKCSSAHFEVINLSEFSEC